MTRPLFKTASVTQKQKYFDNDEACDDHRGYMGNADIHDNEN